MNNKCRYVFKITIVLVLTAMIIALIRLSKEILNLLQTKILDKLPNDDFCKLIIVGVILLIFLIILITYVFKCLFEIIKINKESNADAALKNFYNTVFNKEKEPTVQSNVGMYIVFVIAPLIVVGIVVALVM